MKKISLLAASIGLVLGGCGGSDDNTVAPQRFAVKAIDGYLMHAEVYAGAGCKTRVGTTDLNGELQIDNQYLDQALCVKAIANKTIDSSRGIVTKSFELKAPAKSAVVSPLTDLVVDRMAADSTLTVNAAQAAVTASFAALNSDAAVIFGDYIEEAAKGNPAAKRITVIGETLVDKGEMAKDKLEQLIEIVAEKADDDDLEDFNPVIGGDGNFTANHRPYITLSKAEQDKLEEIEIELGADIEPISLATAFADKDNDSFTLSVQDEDGQALAALGLAFDPDTQMLTGKPLNAGEIELHVYATDVHGARSYPLEIDIDVNSPNLPPVVDTKELAEIQLELDKLAAVQGVAIDKTVDLDDLFDDEDDDNLRLTVAAQIPGVELTVVQLDDLKISGTPTTAGEFTITLTANDGINASVSTELTLKVADNGVTPEPSHPLVGKTWYVTEYGSDNGLVETTHERVWCDTYRFSNGSVLMNERSLANLTECSDDATVEVGQYEVMDGQLKVTLVMEDGAEETSDIGVSDALAGVGEHAKVVTIDGERYTFFANEDDAEKRLDIESDEQASDRSFAAELPAMGELEYQLGMITLQMQPQGNGEVTTSVFFDVAGADFTCAEAREFYQMVLTDGDTYMPMQFSEGQESHKYCVANAHFTPVKDTVYSIIGYVSEGDAALVETIKANIKWTGQGNNE
ncbi:hypothetical protein [Shewanella sp. GXUN23E]|uniref:hypothetical protein n=1 Tax=Shewanella sp. GXUN23E TaxID=3422498 RepID=UPI003D7CE1E4